MSIENGARTKWWKLQICGFPRCTSMKCGFLLIKTRWIRKNDKKYFIQSMLNRLLYISPLLRESREHYASKNLPLSLRTIHRPIFSHLHTNQIAAQQVRRDIEHNNTTLYTHFSNLSRLTLVHVWHLMTQQNDAVSNPYNTNCTSAPSIIWNRHYILAHLVNSDHILMKAKVK